MTPDMAMVAICQEFNWDYYTYLNQPTWFIDLIQDKLKLDSDKIKKESKKSG